MNPKWNIDMIYKMIDLYREKPVLWDTSLHQYRDRDIKNNAWEEIAQALDIDKDAVERKMRILVFQFRRELIKPKMCSGKISKWYAFKQMLFLKAKWAQLGKLRVQSISPEVSTRRNPTKKFAQSNTPTYNNNAIEYLEEDPCIANGPSPPKRTRADYNTEEEPVRLRRNKVADPERDQFAIFGEYVAAKLRNLNNTFASNTAEYHINNILYNADIGKYDRIERRENQNESEENFKNEQSEEELAFEEVNTLQ